MSDNLTGAQLAAQTLKELGVQTVFGLVGVPVTEIAEACINAGIRFIGCRNEQAVGYAATAHAYLTKRPGVCLLVGGPGVIHGMAGIGNSSENAWPLLVLAGSHESYLTTKGAFQEMDAISMVTPHVKLAIRPQAPDFVPQAIANAYRTAWWGRPGPTFIDLPADVISGRSKPAVAKLLAMRGPIPEPPLAGVDPTRIKAAAEALRNAKAPLLVVGKGAAYARAETVIRQFAEATKIPFLPSPSGKGIIPDANPLNTSSARSTALKYADVALVLGGRLNWIFHYGDAPKWNPKVKIIQVDLSAEELGKNGGDPDLAIFGDINLAVPALLDALGGWSFNANGSDYAARLLETKAKNERAALQKATNTKLPLGYEYAFAIIKETLNSLSPPDDGGIVYVQEGSQTMDIARTIFTMEHPRLRLDAGTYATMGLGLAYMTAAHDAYNAPNAQGSSGPTKRKKIVGIEGDSAFGFSAMEVETMARNQMDVLIFVMNNGGIGHGDAATKEDFVSKVGEAIGPKSLRSWALSHQVRYEKIAEAVGGKGYFVQTAEELKQATIEGFKAKVPVVVNVVLDSDRMKNNVFFAWQTAMDAKANL